MADLYERLYCSNCMEHALVVKRRARKDTVIKNDACRAENSIESIRNAMHLAGIKPKRHPTPTPRS